MRKVFDMLDALGIRYLITGSVAASVHGVLRQSQDVDVVLDPDAARFGPLAVALGSDFAIADPIDFGAFSMASVIDRSSAEKVDLILQRLTSELHLRDCGQLLRINAHTVDRAYLERWAARLGVADLLRSVG